MKTRFQYPPINELVIATYFNPPLFTLRSEHVGLFWSRIRDEFPTVEQQQPVGGPEAFGVIGGEGQLDTVGNDVFPMPRFWFVSHDEANLVQLQKNALMLNWRRRNAEYPHYAESLKPAFDRYYRLFEEFAVRDAGVQALAIGRCELTYVNVIGACDYWKGPQDTVKVIPSLVVPDYGLACSTAPAFNCTYVYLLENEIQLRVSIRSAESTTEPRSPLLVFEIRANGRLVGAQKPAADAWFERAHDAVIDCFLRMTSNEVQHTYWKPTGVAQ